MTREYYHQQFKQYTDTLREIRMLSTAGLSEITSAEDYSQVLLSNFLRIGKLAEDNRKVIDGVLTPLLNKEGPLTGEEREALGDLIELLVDADYGEEIDAHISRLAMERLAKDDADEAEPFGALADDERIAALDREVENCYTLMDIYMRGNPVEAGVMRQRGIRALQGLLGYLDREKFAALPVGSRVTVMIDSYYGALLYENDEEDRSDWYFSNEFTLLESSLALVDDPFYRELLPDTEYNWKKHTFGALFYMGRMSLSRSITKKHAQKIFARIRDMETLWKELEDVIGNKISLYDVRLLLLRVARLAEAPEYKSILEKLNEDYKSRDVCDYSNSGMDINLDVPEGYLDIVKDAVPTEETIERYRSMTQSMLSYMFSMPKKENLGNCMTVYSGLIRDYKEYPGGMSFEDFCINSMCALHPPTHVHSHMVAKLSVCLARHLLLLRPELFTGVFGADSADAMASMTDRILDYTWHAALCHDIGKLLIIDTVAMYGRSLLDDEYANLRLHPDAGADLAVKYLSTRDYADVIRGHHLWYDGSAGYPSDYDKNGSPYRTIIDIVSVCDCMDAATDSVGRSYSRGKTFEEFEREVAEASGARYAPWLPELFRDPAARADILFLLDEGRSVAYRKTYALLQGI